MLNSKLVFVLCVVLVFLVITGYYFRNRVVELTDSTQLGAPITTPADCIPTFADGGGPYYKPDAPFRDVITQGDAEGEELIVSGKVLFSDCETPVVNAVLDIWQANASGSYEDEWHRGKVRTNTDGSYTFTTVVPKGYGEGTGYRPPHIHFKVHLNDQELITSQMFFPESRGREGFEDYIMELQTSEVEGTKRHTGYHDIILPLSSI